MNLSFIFFPLLRQRQRQGQGQGHWQQQMNTSRQQQQQRSNMARARAGAMAAANDDGHIPIAGIVRNSQGMNPPRSLPSAIAEQQQQLTLHPGAESGSSTIAE